MGDLDTWPTEQEAADMLQTSVKTIARYAAQGKIERRKRPVPGRKPENVCNPRDIEKLMPAAHVMPAESAPEPAPTALVRAGVPGPGSPAEFLAFIRTIATAIEAQRQIVQMPKLWLSLDEAHAYSGRSKRWLLVMCREGKLTAEKDGGWKIRRASLEAFAG